MPQLAQHAGPTFGGIAISVPGMRPGRGHQRDFHASSSAINFGVTIANSSRVSSYQKPDAALLCEMLSAARARTLQLVEDLRSEQLLGPQLAVVNPPLWEIGHVGWFQEYWCLRHKQGGETAASLNPAADALYDSALVPHAARWSLPLPHIEAALNYLDRVFADVRDRLVREGATDALAYFLQLAAFHEEMHCEAWTYSRQTLGYPAPRTLMLNAAVPRAGAWPGDVEVCGGDFDLGATDAEEFVFDNEKWAHPVHLLPFCMARATVTNAEFAAFVEDGGYQRQELWCAGGWSWKQQARVRHPVYWRRETSGWQQRRYDRWGALAQDEPVVHVNWFEADAYCRWAGRRLPTEAEWEFAATTERSAGSPKRRHPWGDATPAALPANLYGHGDGVSDVAAFQDGDSAWGCRQMFGNVWEWTADWFGPYPGFVRDPYKEYSEPWFGNHKVLRGGSHATRASLLRATWRNFYTPDRCDVFAGFRTCALGT